MSDALKIVLDNAREDRIGFDEAIFCAQKTVSQIESIIRLSVQEKRNRLFTRLKRKKYDRLQPMLRNLLAYDDDARTGILGTAPEPTGRAKVAIVSAGSSDAPVVAEVRETLRYYGYSSTVITDVGVAGIWRLMDRVEEISGHPVVVAVAGMDAALPTVLGGLVPSFIVGVPTSTGYGVSGKGKAAITSMLVSCAPGLTVTNVDNGFGAACAALRILRMIDREQTATQVAE